MLAALFPCLALIALTGCQPEQGDVVLDTAAPATSLDEGAASPEHDVVQSVSQAATDANGPNYVVVGGPYVDLLGEDGEPDELAGRFVNGGLGITAGSANENVWLLLGPTGKLTYLDEDGKPLRGDLLEVLEGNAVLFSTLGERRVQTGDIQSAWLVGGEDGRVQLVNRDGEPELSIKNRLFEDMGQTMPARLIAGGYSAASEQWLVGTEAGRLVGLDTSLSPVTNETATFSGTPIAGIVGHPSASAPANQRWIVAGGSRITYFPGNTPLDFPAETFTTLATARDQIAAGTESGKVGFWGVDGLDDSPQWVDALDGEAIEAIFYNDTTWLVLGAEGGARLIGDDLVAQGAQKVTIGDGSALVSARWAQERWLLATRNSLVFETEADLSLPFDYARPLDGEEVRAAAPGQDVIVVVGGSGKFAVLTKRGERMGMANSVAGSSLLRAASWSGSNFLVGGEDGVAQLLDESGAPMGAPVTLLDGKDIHAISWNGNVWLVAGEDGQMQRVRPSGEVIGNSTAEGFDEIRAARWSGSEWLVVGKSPEDQALVQRIKSDGMLEGEKLTFTTIASFNAVEWSGREWIVGGSDGLAQVISASGMPRTPQPTDVLLGADIHSIDFHANSYLVAGANGLTRRITLELQTSAAPVAAAGLETIYEARWTLARGYGRGECLTNDVCYVGQCLGGGIQDGFCCDSSCNRPCESCLAEKTGGEDGLCAPIPAGEAPVTADGCAQEDPSTCGETGMCDGAGQCALHGTDVVCLEASCTDGEVSPEALCDGAGTCGTSEAVSCGNYRTCEGSDCGVSCSTSDDCVEGYMCSEEGECVEEMEMMTPPMEPEPEVEKGCCAVVSPKDSETRTTWATIFLALIGLIAWRRRRD